MNVEKQLESPIKTRLVTYIRRKGLNNHKFQKICGLSNSFVQNIRKSIDIDTFEEKIAPNFPDLNKYWLYFEDGEMIIDGNNKKNTTLAEDQLTSNTQEEIMKENENLKKLIKAYEKTIQLQEEKIEHLTKEVDKSEKIDKGFINY